MKYTFIVSLATLIGACGSSSSTVPNNNGDSSTPPTAAVANLTASESSAAGTDIVVTLTGGSGDGTFKASSAEPTCSMGLTGEKSFGNQYSENGKSDKELSSVQLIVNDYDEAKNGTSNFNVTFGFGKLFGGQTYSLDPTKGQGSGKATISESGHSRTVTIEGKTDKGVSVKATITCKVVQKLVNGELKSL